MNPLDLDQQLKSLKPTVDVPEGLAGRVKLAVSKEAMKRKKRRLFFEYLGHGFSSVLVAFFLLRLALPNLESIELIIAGALILSMFWLLFKLTQSQSRRHFGRLAFSAAAFGLLVAALGLLTVNPFISGSDTPLKSIESSNDILENAYSEDDVDDSQLLIPTEDTDVYEGDGDFGTVMSISEGKAYMFVKILWDNGEEQLSPIKLDLYENSGLSSLEAGDRVYLEGMILTQVEEGEESLYDSSDYVEI